MHADQHVLPALHLAVDERHMLVAVHVVAIADEAELTELRGQARFRRAMHEALVLQPVGDQLRHRDERQVVPFGEGLELGALGGGAVVGEDLADDAGGLQAREAHQVDGGLGVAHPLEHATLAGAQRCT